MQFFIVYFIKLIYRVAADLYKRLKITQIGYNLTL